MKPKLVWGGLLAVALAFEAGAIVSAADGDTFSEFTRQVFRTHTTPGAAAFAIAWTGFSAWYLVHILKGSIKK